MAGILTTSPTVEDTIRAAPIPTMVCAMISSKMKLISAAARGRPMRRRNEPKIGFLFMALPGLFLMVMSPIARANAEMASAG